MLATAEDERAGTMSFASSTDVTVIAMGQLSVLHSAFIVAKFLQNCYSVV
jgi:hypothetical protein